MKILLAVLFLSACASPHYSFGQVQKLCEDNYKKATFEQCAMVAFNYCTKIGCKNF